MPVNVKRKRVKSKSQGKRPYKKQRLSSRKSTTKFRKSRGASKLNKKAQRIGNAHWLSFAKTIIGKPRLWKTLKQTSPNYFYTNNTGAVTPSAGTQLMTVIQSMYTRSDLNLIKNNCFTEAFFQGAKASTGYTGPGGNDAITGVPRQFAPKLYLRECTSKIFMTNQSNAPQYVDIYDIVARRDQSGGSLYDPVSTIERGLAQTGYTNTNTTSVALDPTFIGVTPFSSQMFCQWFKVLRVTRLNLAGGETAEHVVHTKPNKFFDFGSMVDTTYEGYVRYLTQFTLVIQVGAPDDATNTTVSSANAKLDYICTRQYNTHVLAENHVTTEAVNNVSGAGGSITVVGSGSAAAVANA